MGRALLVLLILAYGYTRGRMPASVWSQAPDLHGYLLGALVPPVLDLLAFVAIARYAVAYFPRSRLLLGLFVTLCAAAGVLSCFRAEAPIVLDLNGARSQDVLLVRKIPPDTVVWRASPRDPATASIRLPNAEQFRRVPVGMMVELRVAPHLGVATVTGVLE